MSQGKRQAAVAGHRVALYNDSVVTAASTLLFCFLAVAAVVAQTATLKAIAGKTLRLTRQPQGVLC
jgi:hypothetical protein